MIFFKYSFVNPWTKSESNKILASTLINNFLPKGICWLALIAHLRHSWSNFHDCSSVLAILNNSSILRVHDSKVIRLKASKDTISPVFKETIGWKTLFIFFSLIILKNSLIFFSFNFIYLSSILFKIYRKKNDISINKN